MSQPGKEGAPAVRKRSGCGSWIVKGLVALVVLVLVGGLAYYLRMQYLDRVAKEESVRVELSQQPQGLALKAVQASDDVKAAIGEPISLKGERGNLRRETTGPLDRSNAQFTFDVAGSKGEAVVNAVARQADGTWQVSKIQVAPAGGKAIDVPPPSAESPPSLDFDVP